MQDSDKRGAERLTINKSFDSFDAFVAEYVSNVSKSGVFIRSASPLPIGTKVNLTFSVVMDGPETIEGIGEVVRIHDDPPGMGVAFTELPKASKAVLERLLVRPG